MYLIILLVEARKLALVAYINLPNVCMYVCMYVSRPVTLTLTLTPSFLFSVGLVWVWHVIKRKRDLELGYMSWKTNLYLYVPTTTPTYLDS